MHGIRPKNFFWSPGVRNEDVHLEQVFAIIEKLFLLGKSPALPRDNKILMTVLE